MLLLFRSFFGFFYADFISINSDLLGRCFLSGLFVSGRFGSRGFGYWIRRRCCLLLGFLARSRGFQCFVLLSELFILLSETGNDGILVFDFIFGSVVGLGKTGLPVCG